MNIIRNQLFRKGGYILRNTGLISGQCLSVQKNALSRSISLSSHQFNNQSLPDFQDDLNNFYRQTENNNRQYPSKNNSFTRDSSQSEHSITDFQDLNLPDKLMETLSDLNIDKPTEIQSKALPILMAGKDLIGIAQTGSGKTLAFLLPALRNFFSVHESYHDHRNRLNPRVLILAPTRELAQQIFDVVRHFKVFKGVCCYGGSDRTKQVQYLRSNNSLILVSTPGRMNDLLNSQIITLKDIDYLVIDEADRMLDMGFEPQIKTIISRCKKIQDRQTMMFSASWPKEVQSLAKQYLKPDHAFLSIGGLELKANKNIKQHIHFCDKSNKIEKVKELVDECIQNGKKKIVIFCATQRWCDTLSKMLQSGKKAAAIHGGLTQAVRERTLEDFRNGRINILCSTNVAARGLDIDNVNVVINYDMPNDIETYVHRIGRTGRKDNIGESHLLFDDAERSQFAGELQKILSDSGNEIPEDLIRFIEYSKRNKNRNQSSRNNNRSNNSYKPRYNDEPRNYRNTRNDYKYSL